jgi:hydrogenase expression/formation protein HypE
MSRSALLVIDLQRDLCLSPKRRERCLAMLPRIKAAIDLFADAGLPVFYLRMILRPGDRQLARYEDTYCLAGSAGADLIPELSPLRGPVIDKSGHGAFFRTSLEQHLQDAGVTQVVLAGLQAHLCVYETAAQAFARGLSVTVLEDCVLSTDPGEQAHALALIAKHYGERITLERLAMRHERVLPPLPAYAPPSDDGLAIAVGDGTAASARFVREEILTRFPAQREAPEDGTRCSVGSDAVVLSTDSYVVEPFFPGGDIGRLAVSGTINDLLASGARPCYLTLGLVLREGLSLDQLRRILDSIQTAALQAGVEIVAGDTKVVPRGDMLLPLIINTTGVGQPLGDRRYALGDGRPGDAILVSGRVGEHALAVIDQRHGVRLGIVSDCASLQDLLLPLLGDDGGVVAMRDPTRGGVAGVLFDLADATGTEIRVPGGAIPVSPAAKDASDLLGLDPLNLANEGKMVLVVRPECADALCARLRAHPLGRDAAIIGKLGKAGQPRVVIDGTVRTRREGVGIPRLC